MFISLDTQESQIKWLVLAFFGLSSKHFALWVSAHQALQHSPALIVAGKN